MQKRMLIAIMLISSCLFVSCAQPVANKQFKIGISQFAEHPALDAVSQGFKEELASEGIEVIFDEKNAQADAMMTTTIAKKFAEDKVDLVLAIATISAQGAKSQISDIPVLFSAVTDPVEAGLVESLNQPGGNFSGTTDAVPIERQLALFQAIDPTIKKVGIIYNTGEINSKIQVDSATEIGQQIGLEIVAIGVTNISEVPQAMEALVNKVDGIYTITDNVVASAIQVVANKAIEHQMVTVGAESSHVAGGILITDGISYEQLGRQTARQAKRILIDGQTIGQMPVETLAITEKAVNKKTLQALDLELNKSVFEEAKEIK